jgi:predicted RNA-binding Zn-ribbon protein involved in translation (DUF1610 family)
LEVAKEEKLLLRYCTACGTKLEEPLPNGYFVCFHCQVVGHVQVFRDTTNDGNIR